MTNTILDALLIIIHDHSHRELCLRALCLTMIASGPGPDRMMIPVCSSDDEYSIIILTASEL